MRKLIKFTIGAILLTSLIIMIYYLFNNSNPVDSGKNLYAWLNKQNVMIAGAITLWLLGVLTLAFKQVPVRIWHFILKQSTITLTINNIDDIYDFFLRWYFQTNRSETARSLVAKNKDYYWLHDTDNREIDVSAGYGIHFFMYKGQIFKFSRELKDAANIKDTKETIVLTTIGRSQKIFHQLIKEITPIPKKDLTKIYKWSSTDSNWKSMAEQPSRAFSSVILPKQQKREITNHLDNF